ncbi:MAG: asparagine synthase (glutamine-hydrolyzing), partial [Candidatus Scalindua sp.]|nr:asparagine synthase (glutamine-hydrolyzing) [Candidatus Scalindua sp.]
MCGICGFTGRANKIILKKMTDSIIHRGPDENGFYSDEKINLGIRRLSIIDVETGHQPIHNEKKNIWIVVNGEIYNYKELRKELKEKGHCFYTDHSDTEVIVHLYEEYGSSFMHKLNGMFAIALWDKDEDKLLVIRDRMGVKPLFYAIAKNILVFGSEIKAILSHPYYEREVNYEAVYHYFTFKNIPAPMTAFKGIFSLLPGEMLTYSNGRMSTEKWWKIKFDENEEYDEGYVTGKIFTLLEDSVKLRMRSDVPFGAYLSRGVDSSAVVALM